jgi:pimeloyl-ACP methyl ester carboxylesterase/aryl carrier-like protein
LADYISGEVGKVLGLEAGSRPNPQQGFIEMGIDSLMVMELLKRLKRDLGLTLYPKEIYERPSIEALANYLVVELESIRSENEPAPRPTPASRSLWTPTAPGIQPSRVSEQRLPGIIFLLSSPRAGSTLLRVMMAGHPRLLCPPELHLLPFETMAERRAALAASYLGEGLQRALMELKHLSAEEGRLFLDDLAERQVSTQEVYALLQELASGRRLVDKSPSYAASLKTLARAEALFGGAKYIHLVRHPYAVIESFVRTRLERLAPSDQGDPYDLAERVWGVNNHNALKFLAPLDAKRHHRIKYEELVRNPATVMLRLCQFLEISFDEAMLRPYEGRRMTDGVYPQSLPIGDPNFLDHGRIDPALGEVWKSIRLPRRLGGFAQRVAAELGYIQPRDAEPRAPCPADLPGTDHTTMRESYLDVRGLGLCLCEWGPEDGPLVLCLHGMLEQGAAWEHVAGELARRGFRVVAPDQRGHGLSGHVGAGGSYHLLDFLADLDAVARSLKKRPLTLVGHSMGAALAALLAGARPKAIDSLVLIECPFPADPIDGEAPQQVATQLDYLASPPPHPVLADVMEAARRLRQSTASLPEEMAVRLARRITQPCEGGVRWRWDARLQTRAGIAFQGIESLNLSGYLETLRGIQASVTLVHAAGSNLLKPEKVGLLQSALNHSRRVVLPGGHNLHLEASHAVAELIAESAALP